jgi:hypothetical protein
MKNSLMAISAVFVICGACLAQQTSPAQSGGEPQQPAAPSTTSTDQQQATGTKRIGPGNVIPVQFTKEIDVKKIKTGDVVEAKVTQDLKTDNGTVIVPRDSKVTGHITAAQARSKQQKESQIAIAFDHVLLTTGTDLNLPMSIQAIIGPPATGYESPNPAAVASSSGGTTGNTSGMPGGGASDIRTGNLSNEAPARRKSQTNGQQNSAQPPISMSTQGVVGISNLKLEPPSNSAQGSVLSSEKNNVKLESGTLMLLRVN